MASRFRILQVALLLGIAGLVSAGLSAHSPSGLGKSTQAPGRAVQAQQKGVTEEQRARLRERAELIAEIVNKHEAEAKALGMPPDWRRPFYEALLGLPLSSLQALEPAQTLQELSVAAAAEAITPQAIGSATEDLVYTPIAPCRFIDTRYAAAGKINGDRSFDLSLNGSAYGAAALCNPTGLFGATDDQLGGLVINVTIFNPSVAPGWLAVKPNQAAGTSSWVNWYQAGATVQAANMGIAAVDQSGTAADFIIHTSSAVHVIVDISGAFLAPGATALETTIEQIQSASCGNNSVCNAWATCPDGWRLTGGGTGISVPVDGFDFYWNGPEPGAPDNAQTWKCGVKNASGVQQTYSCMAVCSRVPGR